MTDRNPNQEQDLQQEDLLIDASDLAQHRSYQGQVTDLVQNAAVDRLVESKDPRELALELLRTREALRDLLSVVRAHDNLANGYPRERAEAVLYGGNQ